MTAAPPPAEPAPAPSLTDRVVAAIALVHGGDRPAARRALDALAAELAADDHFHRCVLAHYRADADDDPREELRWDQLALDAARRAAPADFDDRFPGMTHASFFPSLHLNVAASHERLGELAAARAHADLADAALAGLAATPLGDATRAAIARLRARLAAAATPSRGG